MSDRPEKRFRYSAVAPGAVPLSGGGIDILRRVVKPINASCTGRARVDASGDKELPEHAKDVGTQDVALCEVQILTRSKIKPPPKGRQAQLRISFNLSKFPALGLTLPLSQRDITAWLTSIASAS